MSNEEKLELLTHNVKAKARKATLHGRNYLVVPGTILKEGVLVGSRGRLYYPKSEVEKNPSDWDGMPIVGYHPIINGIAQSARKPEILEKYQLGNIYKTKAKDAKAKTEYWFDEELTNNFDQNLDDDIKIVPRILAGDEIETSTGVYTTNVKAEEDAVFNNEPYDFTAINYRPDHVAVLPDQIGACSVADGCGVCVNEGEQLNTLKRITRYLHKFFSGKEKLADIISPDLVTNADISNSDSSSNATTDGVNGVDDLVGNELSHDQIREQLRTALKANYTQDQPSCYIMDVYDDYFTYEMGMQTYSMNYTKTDTGVTLSGEPLEVIREVTYRTIVPETNMALSPNDRKTKVDYLVTNCAHWKTGQQVLNGLSDDQLVAIETGEKEKVKAATPPILNAEQMEQLANLLKDKLTPPTQQTITPVTTASSTPATPTVATPVAQPLTANEWLAAAPAEIRGLFDDATDSRNQEKANLVNIITANVADAARKQQLATFYNTKDVKELRIIASGMPMPNEPLSGRPRYDGGAGGPVNNGTPVEEEPLMAPTINYEEEMSNRRKAV